MKFARSFWWLLFLGVALRCIGLTHPLADAHLLRQCQTAAATKDLLTQPGLNLTYSIPWLSLNGARYVLEVPFYNYLVIAVAAIVHNLDLAGRLTSILLWSASFVCLQLIWKYLLTDRQAFWANLLFAVSPLGVFFGQAFMPEMLVQLCAFVFVWQILSYEERPTIGRWCLLTLSGLIGLLVKLPEIAHLYLILVFVLFRLERKWILFKPRYIMSAIVTLFALIVWSRFVDHVNAAYLAEWDSTANLRAFIGPLDLRFQLKPWIMLGLYVIVFIFAGPPVLAGGYGLSKLLKARNPKLLMVWLIALMLSYLLWFGNGGTAQSYYNLPAMAPLCALVGIGIAHLLSTGMFQRWAKVAIPAIVALIVIPALPVYAYLFKPDRHLIDATKWVEANTRPDDVILFQLNHRADMVAYPYNAAPGYLSKRRTFIWTDEMPMDIKQMALKSSRFAVVTFPSTSETGALAVFKRWRGLANPKAKGTDWLQQADYHSLLKTGDFEVFQRN